jgi:hypothetical protein
MCRARDRTTDFPKKTNAGDAPQRFIAMFSRRPAVRYLACLRDYLSRIILRVSTTAPSKVSRQKYTPETNAFPELS